METKGEYFEGEKKYIDIDDHDFSRDSVVLRPSACLERVASRSKWIFSFFKVVRLRFVCVPPGRVC